MKHIRKGTEPRDFADWKAQANEDWHPSYGVLSGDVKVAVKSALLKEQGHICCYCERQLADGDSHIEHLVPQCAPGVDSLDFGNMLCSCQNDLKPGVPRHCGMLKADWYDAALFVSPLDPLCETRFAYLGNGAIQPAIPNDSGACETIKRLGLGIPKLNDMRAKAIEPFLDDLTPGEMSQFVTGYLRTDRPDGFSEFYTTIRHLFGDRAA